MPKPDYVRRLSSYKKEAAAALRGNWSKSLLIAFVPLLIGLASLLPIFSAFSDFLLLSDVPVVEVGWEGETAAPAQYAPSEAVTLEQLESAIIRVLTGSSLSVMLALLLLPLTLLSVNRLSLNLLERKPITLRAVLPSVREWLRSIRVSLLGWLYAFWPVLLGYLAILALSITALTTGDVSLQSISQAASAKSVPLLAGLMGGMAVLIWVLMIYSITRAVSYLPAQYLLVMQPEKNARRLLKTSRLLTKGHKGRLFLLCLSFIGWMYLATLAPMLLSSFLSARFADPAAFPAFYIALTALYVLALLPLGLYANTSVAAFVRDLTGANDLVSPV